MNTRIHPHNSLGPAQSWPVVILSDDFSTGRQVGAHIQAELSALGGGTKMNAHVWLFPSLNQPSLRRLAVLQALSANLIVLCSDWRRPLSLGVRGFLREWVWQINDCVAPLLVWSAEEDPAEDAGMLGALSGPGGSPRVPVYASLSSACSAARELARQGGSKKGWSIGLAPARTDQGLTPERELVS